MVGETKLMSIGSLKVGNYIVIDDVACKVVDTKSSKPGKHGSSKINLTAVGLLDDKKRNIVMPSSSDVKVPIVGKKDAQVLSIVGTTANVMDAETFETFDLEIPAELRDDVVEGVTILYWEILEDKVMKQIKK